MPSTCTPEEANLVSTAAHACSRVRVEEVPA
jgi:hypothetical protein